uniref:Uncharacterized protein n=1 Tax=Candidozyma auris TaxID=498019 RepID=A0A0L0P739_CANAR
MTSILDNAPENLDLPVNIVVNGVFLALDLFALVLMLGARFRPNTVQP